jgi:glycosyltransferase involved in cell wall biosynthesis
MQLFLDITRIACRLTGTTPTGIDRVEHAYATRTLRDPAFRDTICVFTAPFFTGALRRDLMLRVLDRISIAWRLNMPAEEDAVYRKLRDYLRSPIDAGIVKRRFRDEDRLGRLRRNMLYPVRDLIRSPTRLQRWLKRTAGQQHCYLNVSHNQLETPERLAWARPPLTQSVFFIHDTIPIDYPEFVAPGAPARHERRMTTTAAMASLVIVNSHTTRRHLESYLSANRQPIPPIDVIPLGVAQSFLNLAATRRCPQPETYGVPPVAGHPYFVTLSTIEPRKNLLFLFTVWRRLIERLGPRTPRLVVTGQRGWENENIADVLERSRELGPFLVEASDLCDDALARLLHGATALIQPSTTEGFGLPLVEGLTLGIPVLASDIDAHREVSAGYARLIDPIDGCQWLETIERLADPSTGLATEQRKAVASYVPMTWDAHVDAALAAIGSRIKTRANEPP